MRLPFAMALFPLFLLLAACGSTGQFVWVDTLPDQAAQANAGVVIKDTDTINVRVFNQDPLSAKEHVRTDGKIPLPVVGEIMARGKTPGDLAKDIEARLKNVVVAPSVSVSVEQAAAQLNISVVGEVKNSGTFQLDNGANVLQALASAGGLSDFADSEKIFVVRKGLASRVRFRYADLRSAEPHAIGFTLRTGDVVVVE